MDLTRFKRLDLFARPTPLQELSRLQHALDCKPRLFVKRDDLTNVGLGGNKVRKLCYVMAEALDAQSDTIITWAGAQSNHCRQTLAMARQVGLDCHLVLDGEKPKNYQGNTLVFSVLGATMHFIGANGDGEQTAYELADQLRSQGRRPYVIPIGASNPLGTLGYIESMQEVAKQSKDLNVSFDHAFLATGSGGTQAGAEIGARQFCPFLQVHGISVSRSQAEQQCKVAAVVNSTYKLLGSSQKVASSEISVYDQYFDAYAVPTDSGLNAIKLLARTEGLLLDPVYTGKALAGMLDVLKQKRFNESEAILFFHTGGFPALFAYSSALGRDDNHER